MKREERFYGSVDSLKNIWQSSRPIRQMSLWGVVGYFGTKSTFQLIDQCQLLIANHQGPPGADWETNPEELARNIAATVTV